MLQWWTSMDPSAQAAWVQTVLTIIALGIAIGVPWWHQRVETKAAARADYLRAMSMAISLKAPLEDLMFRLNEVWRSREHKDDDVNPRRMSEAAENALRIPARLSAMSDRLHELGDAAHSAQLIVYFLGRAAEHAQRHSGQPMVASPREFYNYLWAATGHVTNTLNQIDDMFLKPKHGFTQIDDPGSQTP